MKNKKIIAAALLLMMATSQLIGCSSGPEKEMAIALNNGDAITIDVNTPVDNTQGERVEFKWKELAYLDSYDELRLNIEDAMGVIPFGVNGKNGLVYVDAVGKHTNNSVLKYAFMNKKFVNEWQGETIPRAFKAEAKKLYTDITDDKEALLAGLNAYYNLIDDSNDGDATYSDLYRTLNRLEGMSALVKATTPVEELNAEEFMMNTAVNNEVAAIASIMNDKAYINTHNESLDSNTANGTMTRVEFLYMLINILYPDEYKELLNQEKIEEGNFSDARYGNKLAEKIGFTTEGDTNPKRLESYLLSYCLQVKDNKLPKELYCALLVAKNKGLISSETRWRDGIIKGEALTFLVKAFLNQDAAFSVDRGESTGEAIENIQ